MGQQRYTDDFKREAVRQVTEKDHPVKEVAERLGMSTYSLYEWIKKHGRPMALRRVDWPTRMTRFDGLGVS